MNHPAAPRWRLNTRALTILGLATLAVGLILAVVLVWRAGSAGEALLQQAEAQAAAQPPRLDLALSYLDSYLKIRPDDVRALDRKMELLARTARSPEDLLEAIRTGDRALRAGPDPAAARVIRGRMVKLYLDVARAGPPDQAQLATATEMARALLEGEGRNQAGAHRLLGQVLQARADRGDEAARDEAVRAFEEAFRLDPADVTAGLELARLDQFVLTPPDPLRAQAILDRLLEAAAATGDTDRLVTARLGRYRHFVQAGEQADRAEDRAALAGRADEELRLALEASPAHPTARLMAAESALRRGDVAAARRHFEAIPAPSRSGRQAVIVKGLIELAGGDPEAAVTAWRTGLRDQSGTDPELTWRLAGLLLEMGRTAEAEPLVRQHRRLAGGTEPGPSHRYLLGLLAIRQNRPDDALKDLIRVQQQATDPILRAQSLIAQGQAYEALRDPSEALDRYDEAVRAMPRWSNPRTARSRILIAMGRANDAETELRAALADQPDDPSLLLALGRAQLAVELKRPAPERRWEDLRSTLAALRQVAPEAGERALLEADLDSLSGQGGPAAEALLRAARRSRRNVELWAAAAVALVRLGQAGPALAVLDEAARPDAAGDQGTIRIARSRLLTALGRGGEARAAPTDRADALPADQRASLAAELTVWHRRRGEMDQARAAAVLWSELAPSDPRPLRTLLDLDDQAGDEAAVQRHLTALEGLGPVGLQAARVSRVERLLREPRPGVAESAKDRESHLDEASRRIDELAADPSSRPATAWLRGQLAERRDRPEDAAAAYEDAVREVGSFEAAERLAVLYGRLGRMDRLEDLRRRLPEMGSALDRLATVELVARGREAEAERLAQAVATGDPESLDARLWEARILNSVGKPEEAERRLRALAEGSDEPGPWLALLFFQAGRDRPPAERASTVEQIRSRVTKVEKPELLWAQCWRIAGDASQAEAAFEAALAKWPEDPQVARGAAGFFQATGRMDRAEALLRAVATRDPSQRWASRGLALLRSSRTNDGAAWEEAWKLAQDPEGTSATPEDRLTRAVVLARSPDRSRQADGTRLLEGLTVDLPPDHPIGLTARNLLIEAYAQAGRGDEARRIALTLADPGTDPRTAALLAELALRSGQLEEAASQAARLDSLRPGDPATALLRARVAQARGQRTEALEACLKAVQASGVQPEDRFEAVRLAVGLAVEAGAPEDLKGRAEAVIEAALKGGGSDQVEVLQLASYLRHVQGRFDDEMDLYRRLDALRPESPWYLNNMAWTLSEDLGRPEAALPVIDRLLKLVGDHPSCLDTRGMILLRLGQVGPAIDVFRRTVAADPANAVYQYHLARAYLKDGQDEAFRAHRDLARQAGLKADQLQASERAELDQILAR